MKMQIKEFADIMGVSVRTLRYYDEIGLLKPSDVDRCSGYRYYDENALARMQEILFYRELDFSLKSICDILTAPDYDRGEVLLEQKKLLTLKKERLERLIAAIDKAAKGEMVMNAFDNSEFEQYKAEAEGKWGKTRAYAEFERKSSGYSRQAFSALGQGMETVFAEFAVCMTEGNSPASKTAQLLVRKLQNYITEHFYTCSNAILAGLGQMYVSDDRFRKNIDKHAEGTAEFVGKAIENYTACQ